jgi:hypothetical protein
MRPAIVQAVLIKILRELLAFAKRWPATFYRIYLL